MKLAADGVDAMNAPVVISSLGAFGVRAAAPIVVPPSVGTLFIGSAHREMLRNGKQNETAEVITLSLTFDHRVVNGAGAANFAHEIKEQIEEFMIPVEESASPSRSEDDLVAVRKICFVGFRLHRPIWLALLVEGANAFARFGRCTRLHMMLQRSLQIVFH